VFDSFSSEEVEEFFRLVIHINETFNRETMILFYRKKLLEPFFPRTPYHPLIDELQINESLFTTFLWYVEEMLKGDESTFQTADLLPKDISVYRKQRFICQVVFLLLKMREREILESSKLIRKILLSLLKTLNKRVSEVDFNKIKDLLLKRLKEMKLSPNHLFSPLTQLSESTIWHESMRQSQESDKNSAFDKLYKSHGGLLSDAFERKSESLPSSKKDILLQNLRLAIEGLNFCKLELQILIDEDRRINDQEDIDNSERERPVEQSIKYYSYMEDLYLRFAMNLLLKIQ
jgi:hypothetical protein